jgi:hypothetical protein
VDGDTVASRHVISEKFTGFDSWPFGSRRLCMACAWAYSRAPNQVKPMVISAAAVVEYAKGAELTSMLAGGALAHTHAVVLPTACRRHVLATAEWGRVAVDDFVVAWDAAAAARLVGMTTVRPVVTAWVRANATSSTKPGQIAGRIDRALRREMPPYALLTTLPRDGWQGFVDAWVSLQPWRSVPALWDLVKVLTHSPAAV